MVPRSNRTGWFDATPLSALYMVIAFLLAVVGTWIIGIVVFGPAEDFVLKYIDRPILDFVRDNRAGLLTDLMKFFTFLGSNLVLFVAGIGLAVWSYFRTRDLMWPVYVAVVIVGAFFLDDIVKGLVERPRPHGGLVAASGFSFPSGHALNAAVLAGLFGFLLTHRRGRVETLWIWRGLGLLAFLIAFSRVYLSVHWPLDIVGGLGLGAFWVSASVAAMSPR